MIALPSRSPNLTAGRWLPTGVDDCAGPDCRALAQRNTLSTRPGLFRAPTRGDLRLRSGYRAPNPALPQMDWTDGSCVHPSRALGQGPCLAK